jgi:hypothetical protein
MMFTVYVMHALFQPPCHGIKLWHRDKVSSHGIQTWHQVVASSHGIESWQRVVASSHGLESWHRVMTLNCGNKSWHQVMTSRSSIIVIAVFHFVFHWIGIQITFVITAYVQYKHYSYRFSRQIWRDFFRFWKDLKKYFCCPLGQHGGRLKGQKLLAKFLL